MCDWVSDLLQPGAMNNNRQEAPAEKRAKAGPLIAVIAIHVAALAVILNSSRSLRQFVESAGSLVMILLPEPPPRPETTPPEHVTRSHRRTNPRRLLPQAPHVKEAPADSTAPVALPRIDWRQELEHAAQRKADVTPWQAVVPKTDKKSKHDRVWKHWREHRIEVDKETGIPVLNLGEHCVLIAFLIPGCRIGRIKPRGDLFDGMDDPDRPGSVPDAPTSDVVKSD